MEDAGTSTLIVWMGLVVMIAEPIVSMVIQDSQALFLDIQMMNFVSKQYVTNSSKQLKLKSEKILSLSPLTGTTTVKILP